MSDDLTFATAYVGPEGTRVHYARCEYCMYGSHYPTPTWHSWAGPDDVAHALTQGQSDPSDKRCACPCVDDATFCRDNAFPEPEVIEVISLTDEPCAVCGEPGACAYDADDRPMVHATPGYEDDGGSP